MPTSYARLNTILLLLSLMTGLAILGMLALRAEGGPLDPPGAPASTDGVRQPGTPISSLPFVINQAGYYYVTRDLTAPAGQNGITINTGNVTVDLGGFRLLGGATPGDGVLVTGGFRNITVRNGSVRSWSDGIDLLSASMSRIESVQSSSNSTGFRIGLRSLLHDCNASLNDLGIEANYAVVRDCLITENNTGVILQDYALAQGNVLSGNAGFTAMYVIGGDNTIRANDFLGNSGSFGNLYVAGDDNYIAGNAYCFVPTNNGAGSDFEGNKQRTGGC